MRIGTRQKRKKIASIHRYYVNGYFLRPLESTERLLRTPGEGNRLGDACSLREGKYWSYAM